VVEDDPVSRQALTLLLEAEGYAVRTAANGREALDRLASPPYPHLILLDLMMPVLSGWEFRRRQLQNPVLAGIPVVVLSATGDQAAEEELLGDVGYLQKPVDIDRLSAVLGRFAAPRKPGVLVVDGEPAVRRVVDVALRHEGFAVRLACRGEQALDIYREHWGGIDVVLLDVRLPGRLDGPQTFEVLKALDPAVRVVFMSGGFGRHGRQELLAMGAAGYLPKPFRLDELSRVVGQAAS
jgi:CheY-like chemotaxis protein